jgi:hypothetical protein
MARALHTLVGRGAAPRFEGSSAAQTMKTDGKVSGQLGLGWQLLIMYYCVLLCHVCASNFSYLFTHGRKSTTTKVKLCLSYYIMVQSTVGHDKSA